MYRGELQEPPVKEGQIIENFTIIGTGIKGDGVGKHDNYVIIVPKTKEGQTYTIKVNKVYPKNAFGEVVN